MRAWTLSSALVVQITRRMSGGNARKGITAVHVRRHKGRQCLLGGEHLDRDGGQDFGVAGVTLASAWHRDSSSYAPHTEFLTGSSVLSPMKLVTEGEA
jgi:hypothetical protein